MPLSLGRLPIYVRTFRLETTLSSVAGPRNLISLPQSIILWPDSMISILAIVLSSGIGLGPIHLLHLNKHISLFRQSLWNGVSGRSNPPPSLALHSNHGLAVFPSSMPFQYKLGLTSQYDPSWHLPMSDAPSFDSYPEVDNHFNLPWDSSMDFGQHQQSRSPYHMAHVVCGILVWVSSRLPPKYTANQSIESV
jgi:hypothetical protein